ncbi:MAG: hypothetical protein LC119_15130 [Burkholderiales bacterium]|nr:hypothetical protein [Burkholderiales bacterium]
MSRLRVLRGCGITRVALKQHDRYLGEIGRQWKRARDAHDRWPIVADFVAREGRAPGARDLWDVDGRGRVTITAAGTCYRAAGWVPVALVKVRLDDGGNRALRWLPGLRAPSTETIDRVRWEIGPDAATTRVHRDSDGVWRPVPQEDAAV